MRLILLGAPGAGKGTQAEILSRKLGIPVISTGNILRAAMKNGTPVGLKAKQYVESGALVPDDVIIGIVEERLAESDCANGYILDGMPRTIPQAEALEQRGIQIDCALSIDVDDETIVQRMSGRRTCLNCGATYHVVSAPPKGRGCLRQLRQRAHRPQGRRARDRQEPPCGVPPRDRASPRLLRPARQAEDR